MAFKKKEIKKVKEESVDEKAKNDNVISNPNETLAYEEKA